MSSLEQVTRSLARRARSGRWLTVAAAGMLGLLASASAPACPIGDAYYKGFGEAFDHQVNLFLVLVLFNVVSWFIEAAILSGFLQLGYWKAFGLSVLVNVVSTVLGLTLWAAVFHGGGWKNALDTGQYGRLGALFTRSLGLTVVEEGLILMLVLRRRLSDIAVAVTVANLVTYVLALIFVSSTP